jgi:hypothetical protein
MLGSGARFLAFVSTVGVYGASVDDVDDDDDDDASVANDAVGERCGSVGGARCCVNGAKRMRRRKPPNTENWRKKN